MPALPKPHRVAVLVPDLTIEGPDAAFEREAAVLIWTACIEILQRHPRLAVLDADATPLFPQDGHFAPQHAGRGGRPTDAFFAPTRRDEVVWLELVLSGKPGVVRLHTFARDGKQESFDALGRAVGEQIQQVLGAWLTARGLGPLPRRFEPVATDEVLAVVRVIAPTLAEQARAWSLPAATTPRWGLSLVRAKSEHDDDELADESDVVEQILESTIDSTLDEPIRGSSDRRSIARPLANRLPVKLRVPALRVLELALREDLAELVLAADPEHPQALFARFERTVQHGKDFELLRKVIATAPGWARPYEELQPDGEPADAAKPSELEAVAAASIAAVIRPGNLDVLEIASRMLDHDRRTDEGLRLVERGVALDGDSPRAHLALLDLHKSTGRVGAWLDQSMRSASQHGCPMDPFLPWYPDQIHVDLRASNALFNVGRLDEAIALRANRLATREGAWPIHTRTLEQWRTDPRFVAWCYAREGFFRGDEARAVEAFGRIEPDDSVDLAIFLESLAALGREDEVALAWAQFGLGRDPRWHREGDRRRGDEVGAVARLAAARALMAAGDSRRGLEELWRVGLCEPGRDEHVTLSRCGTVLAGTPIDVIEAALADRVAIGASTLARRMARDAADFVPAAASSAIVLRALGKLVPIELDPAWLGGFAAQTPSRRAIDGLFAELGPLRKAPPSGLDIADELRRGDRLVNRWLEVVFAEAAEDDRASLAQAAAYCAAQALGRYLAATTAPPTTIAGALRTVAGEALALVRRLRAALGDREARALIGTIEPLLRRIDRWIGVTWLATVERSLRLDERSNGDVVGFVRDCPTVAARILGPEETAVLSWAVARQHRERRDSWAARVATQAARLASHTGSAGVDEWADAIVAQLDARELELDDAIDALHTACYLADGISAKPCVHAARVLFAAGRAPAAFAALCGGMRAASDGWRDAQLATLAEPWRRSGLDVPFELDKVSAGLREAVQRGDAARAEKLARWAIAYDPRNDDAHHQLGIALAQQGKPVDAMHHLALGAREQAAQLLSSVLDQAGKPAEALAVLDYASRWYVRANQWLTYAGIAQAANDRARAVRAFRRAYELDPAAFEPSQLDAFAAVLDELGDIAGCEQIAQHLVRAAGDDRVWKTRGWNRLACAYIGAGKLEEACSLAQRAVDENPLPDNAEAFAKTLARASQQTPPERAAKPPTGTSRPQIYALLEGGDHAAAAKQARDPSWRVRRAALQATRFRLTSENQLEVTPRARGAAVAVLADTVGTMDREALLARALALHVREQAYFARDPVPRLGDRMSRETFHREFRARGGVVLGAETPPPVGFVDRVVVPGSKVARASDYIALLRDLAALPPREALAQFDLDDAGYLDLARAWAAAMDADPSIASTITAGLAKR